jgi:hypothetical protein
MALAGEHSSATSGVLRFSAAAVVGLLGAVLFGLALPLGGWAPIGL